MDILLITLLFLFCALLLAVELFILPGTTIAGIAAGCCLVAANYIVLTASASPSACGCWPPRSSSAA